MAKASAHKWEFKARFRRHAFGWKSQPAIQRVKQAVSEIRKVARHDLLLAAEGAVTLLERLSPALEHVDSSSGAIGAAVNNAIAELVPIIAKAPADPTTREAWLERLWEAHEADQIPYIETLADYWGELCASKEVASAWADRLLGITRMALSPDKSLRGHFHGTDACLSALYRAERYAEIVDILQVDTIWPYKRWAVKALAAMGRKAEAIRYAESCRGQLGRRRRGRRGLRGDPAVVRHGRRGVRALRPAGEPRRHLPRDLSGCRQEVPAQGSARHPRRPREDDAGRRGQVVRRRQGGRALRRGARPREPNALATRRRSPAPRGTSPRSSRPSPSAPACSPSTGSCRATATRSRAPTSGPRTRAP